LKSWPGLFLTPIRFMAPPRHDARNQHAHEPISRDARGPSKLSYRQQVPRADWFAKLDSGVGRFETMNANETSVFDLSPSEKLQLVEDLWDDLAATPDSVPVYDWQKDELARRKANLLKNPASGLSWQEVQRRVRSRYGR
jgi:putative addiction module component (TIGR02574 family)